MPRLRLTLPNFNSETPNFSGGRYYYGKLRVPNRVGNWVFGELPYKKWYQRFRKG